MRYGELLNTFLRHFLFSGNVGFPDDEVSFSAAGEQRLMAQLIWDTQQPGDTSTHFIVELVLKLYRETLM